MSRSLLTRLPIFTCCAFKNGPCNCTASNATENVMGASGCINHGRGAVVHHGDHTHRVPQTRPSPGDCVESRVEARPSCWERCCFCADLRPNRRRRLQLIQQGRLCRCHNIDCLSTHGKASTTHRHPMRMPESLQFATISSLECRRLQS